MEKHGQMGDISGLVITILVVGVIIGVGFMIFGAFENTTNNDSYTVINETVPTVGAAGKYLFYNYSTNDTYCYNSPAILYVVNITGGNQTLQSTNYSVSAAGLLNSTVADSFRGTTWGVTYTYQSGGPECNAINVVSDSTYTIVDFLPIIIILVIVGILLAIVFATFGGMGKGRTAEM